MITGLAVMSCLISKLDRPIGVLTPLSQGCTLWPYMGAIYAILSNEGTV